MTLESDGVIDVWDISTGKVVAQYEGLEVHETMLLIEQLKAQIEELTASAIVRADKQAILIDALKGIKTVSKERMIRHVASVALDDIGE